MLPRRDDPGRPGADLPVRAVLPTLLAALDVGAAVLVSPPGTGKTTLVPLALADRLAARAGPGGPSAGGPSAGGPSADRVVVAEPRRIAARAAAHRMAALLGESVGRRVGYTVRGQSRTGAGTRVEVVTTGVLVQRLQHEPDLPGVGAVLIDECHERHLETDLALAFTVDVRSALRPDLLLVAASATIQAERIAAVLGGPGGPARVVSADGDRYPVQTRWCPAPPGITPPHGLHVDPRFLDHVAAVVRRALDSSPGDALVFLPGAGEIAAVAGRLAGTAVDVVPLHGGLPPSAQDAALRPAPAGRRRVVLATAVAESSLTVPGVRLAVDAGLARVPRLDLARGLGSLVTVRASRAAAVQRAGRCGREGPGTVYRCWSAAEHERLPAVSEPAVATGDLTAYALHLALWGTPGGEGLSLPDRPPAASMEVAVATLRGLGAVDGAGRATARGRALARAGVHPRLARALLDGAAAAGARPAAEIVALLADETLPTGDDLVARWRDLRRGSDPAATARWREEVARLRRAVPPGGPAVHRDGPAVEPGTDDVAAAAVVGLAFPERLARARHDGGRTYVMASGTAAELAESSGLRGAPWLAVAVADRPPGRRDARIRLAVPLSEATARQVGAPLLARGPEVAWADGDVRARDVERLGAIELRARPLPDPDPALVAAAVAEGLRREGLDLLRWTPAARRLRARLAACRIGLGDPWPAVDDDALLGGLPLGRARSRAELHRIDVAAALRAMVPPQVARHLDELAPERVEVPSGSRVAVDYDDPAAPTLPVRVQEVFGWTATPRVAGRPVLLRLLSPADRPVAVTSDLPSFWSRAYPRVRAELRGRYPRHAWPEDPVTAPATRHPTPRA